MSSGSPNPDEKNDEKNNEEPWSPKPRGPGCIPWRYFYFRCFCFFVLEVAFIVLAICLQFKHPFFPFPILYTHFETTAIKSATGTLFGLWHAIAEFTVSGIVLEAFSREWSIHDNNKKPKDSVSTITSGLWDQFCHLFWCSSRTSTFVLAMLASVSGFCLLRVGPFVIVVENNSFERNITVGGLILGTSDMSHAAVKVEQVLGLNLGYSTQSNFVIPKPAYNASRSGGLLHYDSDVIAFNHSCEWHAPSFNSTTQIAVIGSEEFTFNRFRNSPSPASTTFGTGIFALSQGDSPTGHSAFLIFGGNSTLKLNSDNFSSPDAVLNLTATPATGNTIDLSDLPVAYNASWFNFSSERFTAIGGGPLVFRAPLVTALLCNVHPVLTTGTVSLASNNLNVTLHRSHSRSFGNINVTLHHNYVGNINETDVPTYFTWAHHGVGDIQEYVTTRASGLFGGSSDIARPLLVDFTALAAHVFLPEIEPDAWPTASLRPLPLDQISLHMDALVLSASKAQRVEATLGFTPNDLLENSGSRGLLAKEQTPDQILESNLLWLVLTAGFALLTLLLSIIISYRIHNLKEEQPPFDLEHICENSIVINMIKKM